MVVLVVELVEQAAVQVPQLLVLVFPLLGMVMPVETVMPVLVVAVVVLVRLVVMLAVAQGVSVVMVLQALFREQALLTPVVAEVLATTALLRLVELVAVELAAIMGLLPQLGEQSILVVELVEQERTKLNPTVVLEL
jgi:hypothetical protein